MTDPPDSFIWYGNPRSLTISYSGLNSKFGDILNSVIGLVCNKVQTVSTAQIKNTHLHRLRAWQTSFTRNVHRVQTIVN